ncbi:molecular chaperone Tir [Paraburkholderia sp. UYCP14C]|uniref:CesT family type III secretion system chaperone n=1 Tax=Paraburkholderia sp. UYCP14C TaxID=2511130 RepID=UPI0010210430|nr:CesT family type III secretion system chaperone [Paraburkholderia sp. UYCP14C]RZF23814.1 molecular chaperone Tir [Paraburkholderia sp. UYCP14C]
MDTNDSSERYAALVRDLCATVGLADAEHVLSTRSIEVEGFDVRLEHFENDLDALYANFHYGTVTAGRTLIVFRLMLEANLMIYAQDQAQLGLDTDTGGIVLVVRVPMTHDVDGTALAELLSHYAEHGRYWRRNIIESTEEMFEGIVAGEFSWLRA